MTPTDVVLIAPTSNKHARENISETNNEQCDYAMTRLQCRIENKAFVRDNIYIDTAPSFNRIEHKIFKNALRFINRLVALCKINNR